MHDRHVGLEAFEGTALEDEGQGHDHADEEARPHAFEHRHFLLAEKLGRHIEKGQNGHRRQHEHYAGERRVMG